ncbi:uncharacterized protein LOC114720407 [Neltuma alba]|uniref:uncharacterized protein LOC114720407 n=1 Tax=Neltuma alba TaxID=207710 RepID=UPI0010A2CC3A|nr:uncharacterized protein LOC114720407 [Prosopis alba]
MSCARRQEGTIKALHENAPSATLFGHRFAPSSSKGPGDVVGSQSATPLGFNTGPLSSSPSLLKPKAPETLSVPKNSAASVMASSPSTPGSSKPSRQLSKREMDERRRKGLCYWCPEKYSSNHRCKESHLFVLVVDDDDEHFEDALEEVPSDSVGTINAIEVKEGGSTLKLLGRIKNQQVIILVDTGSTHNVLDVSIAKRLQLKP